MNPVKKVFKTIVIIVVVLGLTFGGYRYYTLKKEGKLDKVFEKTTSDTEYLDSYGVNSEGTIQKHDVTKTEKEETSENSGSEESTFVVERKDYDGYYNKFVLDNTILLYEGSQINEATHELLDILIKDADDTLYSKPTVVLNNFGLSQNTVTAADLENYKAVLKQAKSALGSSGSNVSFEYNALKTMVNKVIITKK